MPTQLLVNILAVGPLAPAASVTLAHNLASNDVSVADGRMPLAGLPLA